MDFFGFFVVGRGSGSLPGPKSILQTIVCFFEVLVWKNGLRYGFKFFCASTLLAEHEVTKFLWSYDNFKVGFETREKRDFC